MLSLLNPGHEIMFCSYLVLGGSSFYHFEFLLEVKEGVPHDAKDAKFLGPTSSDNERLSMIHGLPFET
jgi:hypothetical protein